jgi:hypothetical protein
MHVSSHGEEADPHAAQLPLPLRIVAARTGAAAGREEASLGRSQRWSVGSSIGPCSTICDGAALAGHRVLAQTAAACRSPFLTPVSLDLSPAILPFMHIAVVIAA